MFKVLHSLLTLGDVAEPDGRTPSNKQVNRNMGAGHADAVSEAPTGGAPLRTVLLHADVAA
jgi:hypothetical protein